MKTFGSYTKMDMEDPEKALSLLKKVVRNYHAEPHLIMYDEFRKDAELALYVADIVGNGLDPDSYVLADERVKEKIEMLANEVEKHIRPHF
jgi:hypothetical protein